MSDELDVGGGAPAGPEPGSEPSACCALLRCKSLYYRADERPGWLHASDVMTYWCEETASDAGPDADVVDHARCQNGRGCFEPAPGADLAV